jgi:hypothetical protein
MKSKLRRKQVSVAIETAYRQGFDQAAALWQPLWKRQPRRLFQLFSQETDKKTVDALLDQEFARHIKQTHALTEREDPHPRTPRRPAQILSPRRRMSFLSLRFFAPHRECNDLRNEPIAREERPYHALVGRA